MNLEGFSYENSFLMSISDELEYLIKKNGKEMTENEVMEYFGYSSNFLKDNGEKHLHHKYPQEIIEKFKEAKNALDIAYAYVYRIDLLLRCDDDEYSFLQRLEEDIVNIKK
jgi:hypothetical protein